MSDSRRTAASPTELPSKGCGRLKVLLTAVSATRLPLRRRAVRRLERSGDRHAVARRSGGWKVEADVQWLLDDQERAAADWPWQQAQSAGLGTDTLPTSRCWWLPLSSEAGPLLLFGGARRMARYPRFIVT